MMKEHATETIIYGGAFNPPTRAHQAILQACIDYAEPRRAEVWLLPSASRKDKAIELSRADRLALSEALLKDVMHRTVEVRICTIELDDSAPTETYATVQELQREYPDRDFKWVFGSDSIATMPSWGHGEWLRENLHILVVERPGSPLAKMGTNVMQLLAEREDISSTEVRRRMHTGEPYEELVGSNVATILMR